ncbi:type I-C CRISPR-associated protein Cas5c [Desulforhabdus sp. TSK]|uniref:type I-C CRISPR-associated protein Cas5c n=1 Tax=Desulforhabdus sp. TSK TaxID=2925014 RepID=UPI001FC7EA1C|nr:type I-C CRISPR-associated protein Cas5c [Desulforhabdus sp. TSK]GKT08810.1 type I-C CRISPR-associated protein Cas5 [Desulforhabdus sp. TSK]
MSAEKLKSRTFRLKVWGENACFTRPEMKVERVSYDVITPSAARGILEAILWKPAIRWQITRIDVLKPIRWTSVRRNEVGAVMSPRANGLFVEEQRQQRAGLFLRDVAYIIHAFFEMTAQAGDDDNLRKFEEMFLRRSEKGQCFHRPYFGCREFAANFEPLSGRIEDLKPIDESRDLGFMLYDMDHSGEEPMPLWFRAKIQNGSVNVPLFNSTEVRR